MSRGYGGYEATLDTKGRFLLPGALKKLLPEGEAVKFFLTKGVDGNLNLFTEPNWEPFRKQISALNDFNKKERYIKRFFLDEAAELDLDSAGRLLVPSALKEFGGLQKDIKLFDKGEKIEIWDSNTYKKFFESYSLDDISNMTDEILGGQRS